MPITAYTGIESAKAVLQEDVKLPSTKAELIKHQGWKVIDLTIDKRVHLHELLSQIPKKTYHSLQEVITELEVIQ